VGVTQILELGIAAEAGKNLDSQLVEQRQHAPQVTGNVILADQVDGVLAQNRRFCSADDVLEHDFASQAVADILVADKAGGIDRNYRHIHFFLSSLADRFHIVAGHGGYTGGIDKDSLGLVVVALGKIENRLVELLFAAKDDIILQHFSGKSATEQLGIGGAGAAVVPGVAGTGNRAMHQMDDIGDRHQHDTRSVIGATAFGSLPWFGFLAEFGGTLVVGFTFGYIVIIWFGHGKSPASQPLNKKGAQFHP